MPSKPESLKQSTVVSKNYNARERAISAFRIVIHHVKHHVGVGIICSVAYFDPGNWSVDLQAGSSFGYRPMLFVILMAGLGAVVLQTLASKLGCVTGIDLASHCRLLLHDHPKHPRLVRRMALYPLYILSEIAIISTDLAELLGSAIGLCLLFPKLPLWGGVVLTAVDVLIFLVIGDPSHGNGRPVKLFEITIIFLVFAVLGCFVVLLVKVSPNWSDVFLGFVPAKNLFESRPDAVYTAVGILGATVMPHGLFLGSYLATQDRVSPSIQATLPNPIPARNHLPLKARLRSQVSNLFRVSRAERVASSTDYRSKYGIRDNNSLDFIQQHFTHGIVDVVSSLIGLAVPINSAILILAAAVFFRQGADIQIADLFDAHDLIKSHVGSVAAVLFALALLSSGQTSSITATLAGQLVSEGFIEWRISPFFRRLITRLISLIPSVIVAVAVGRAGINNLLVASQVVLSVVLPFVALPLIYLTSSEAVMRVRRPREEKENEKKNEKARADDTLPDISDLASDPSIPVLVDVVEVADAAIALPLSEEHEYVDFSNGRVLAALSYFVWVIVVAANGYAIVSLAMGITGK